jgi:L-2-hydroxyglutarate oxidase LhgO
MQLQIKDMPDPLKFVEQKNVAVELKTCVKNWERKIEIAEVAAKKSKTIIKNAGGYAEEIIRPNFLEKH